MGQKSLRKKRKESNKSENILPQSRPEAKEGRGGGSKNWYLLLAVVGVITLVSYLNCVNNQFVFDDFHLISKNPTIRGIDKIPLLLGMGEKRVSYRPIRAISYAVDFSLNRKFWRYFGRHERHNKGLNPFGYHISNLVYHMVASFLVFLVVFRLAANRRVAFLAAALFALHPVHTDSVTYLSGRRDILFTLFYLAGFYFFLCYRRRRKSAFIIASFLAYLLSLGSKEMAVTLPAVFLCYDLVENFPGKTNKINFAYFKELFSAFKKVFLQSRYLYSLLFIGALAYSYYKIFIKSPSNQSVYYGDSMLTTFLTVGKILFHYIWLLLYPIRLNADYSYNAFPLSSSFFEPATLFPFILLGVIGYAVLRLLINHKMLAFGVIWFFVTLLPVCHIFPHHELLAEHYLYLPSFGFCLIVAFLVNSFLKRGKHDYLIYSSFIIVLLSFSIRIVDRNRDWRDELTLWEKTVKTSSQCARAHNNLGYTYVKKDMLDKGILAYEKALAIRPAYEKVHCNLGSAYRKKGELDKAILKYKEAIALKPRYAKAHHKLGNAYSKKGMLDKAILAYKKVLTITPNNAKVHYNLGNAYHKKGEFNKAISEYKQALLIKPIDADVHHNLGLTYNNKGMLDEAIIEYKKALSIKSYFADAHYNLGNVYIKKGMLDEAISEHVRTLDINPDFVDVHYNLFVSYYYKGNYKLALFHCDKTVELGGDIDPKFLELLKPYR